MDDPDEISGKILNSSRFWIQRVFVPILVIIGMSGNIITVMVLTRRRMRCTTTIYLTALAVADIIYLLFVLLLSFEHYGDIHQQRYELYWRFYGITHWLCDAASSTSVWLTVSFTIERYIVVFYPIRGPVYCTESRAKSIISVIAILCLLSTASTTFEYQLKLDESCGRKSLDNLGLGNPNKLDNSSWTESPENRMAAANGETSNYELEMLVTREFKRSVHFKRSVNVKRNVNINDNQESVVINNNRDKETGYLNNKDADGDGFCNGYLCEESDCVKDDNSTVYSDCCEKVNLIDTEPTNLGKNTVYLIAFYWFSAIGFGLLPLVLIATFNCFLVRAVYRSQKQRRRLTNNSQEAASQRNENRITLLLIGVVILFLICQTPTASFLIYDAFDGVTDTYSSNVKKTLGNIFNFLLTINASCNFILYCVLSEKFRRTFHVVFCERKLAHAGGRHHQDTVAYSRTRSSRFSNNSNATTTVGLSTVNGGGGGGSGKRRQDKHMSSMKTPRNIETQSLTSIPRSRSLMMRPIGKARSTDLNV